MRIYRLTKLTPDLIIVSREADGRDRGTAEYKQWRTAVFVRDNYTCRICGKRGVTLNAHHIEMWSRNPAKRFDVTNGISLCEECHKEVHRRMRKNGRN